MFPYKQHQIKFGWGSASDS